MLRKVLICAFSLLLASCSSTSEKSSNSEKNARQIWHSTCASCHGEDGKPPAQWEDKGMREFGTFGMSMGFFFGGDKMRAGIARTIKNGKGTSMPAFGGRLTDPEIEALVKFIENL